MSIPKNKQELIEWCYRTLGAPILKINISPEQADDRVEEALQKYYQHHYDATETVYYVHTVTQDDIDNKYITLPEDVMVVKGMLNNYENTGTNFMSYEYQLYMSDLVNNIQTGIISYYMRKDYLALLSSMFNDKVTPRYKRHKNTVELPKNWVDEFTADESVVILELSMKIDGGTYTDIWNDDWLKRYTTALLKYQWGRNLSKFENVELLGGVTVSGSDLRQEAKEEIDALKLELREVYEEPPDAFWMG